MRRELAHLGVRCITFEGKTVQRGGTGLGCGIQTLHRGREGRRRRERERTRIYELGRKGLKFGTQEYVAFVEQREACLSRGLVREWRT